MAGVMARAGMGPAQAVSGRYAALSLVLLVCTVIMLVDLYGRRRWAIAAAAACAIGGIAFNVAAYVLYAPVMEGQRNTIVWNAQRFLAAEQPSSSSDWPITPGPLSAHSPSGRSASRTCAGQWRDTRCTTSLPYRSPRVANRRPGLSATLISSRGRRRATSFQGWVGVKGRNLLTRPVTLTFRCGERSFAVPTVRMSRADVALLLVDPHLFWSGFVTFIDPRSFPAGTCEVGAEMQVSNGERADISFGISETFPYPRVIRAGRQRGHSRCRR